MNRKFYSKLARENIKKNPQVYYPFMFLSITAITIFFIIFSLSKTDELSLIRGGAQLRQLLGFGTVVIGIFSAIIIFYGNSFIAKKRNKEIGIYSVLGMEKRHIKYVVFIEYLIMFFVSLVIGLIVGTVLNQLSLLILLKMLGTEVRFFAGFQPSALINTAILFLALFLVTSIINVIKINIAYPIELLRSDDEGEKNPKAKWLPAIIGFISLGLGYYIALIVKSPVDAMLLFLVAVILVIIGTFCLFSFGSTLILNLLQKSKNIYYKKNNFISISGMKFRMKQNAAGLASVCILSTCVLVTLSTTLSMFIGAEDLLINRYPKEMSILMYDAKTEKIAQIDDIVKNGIEKYNLKIDNVDSYYMLPIAFDNSKVVTFVTFTSLEEHNRLAETNYTLNSGEALVYFFKEGTKKESLDFDNINYKIKEQIAPPDVYISNSFSFQEGVEVIYAVLPTEKDVIDIYNEKHEETFGSMDYYYNFDLIGTAKDKEAFGLETREPLTAVGKTVSDSRSEGRESFYALHGGLLFLGAFLGILFIMTTTIIIYYKQISEGQQDKRRFQIMRKVGMSDKEIKSVIKTQILQVFFIPLIMSIIHMAFAFPIMTNILKVFNMTDTLLFFISTVGVMLVFSIIYAIVYSLTSKTYYNIISQTNGNTN